MSSLDKNASRSGLSFIIGMTFGVLVAVLLGAFLLLRQPAQETPSAEKKIPFHATRPVAGQPVAAESQAQASLVHESTMQQAKQVGQAESQTPAKSRAQAEASESLKAATADQDAPLDGGAPVIMSPEPLFDFGEHENVGVIHHDFVIRNEGDAVLKIKKVNPTCMCTVAQPKKSTLAPGEETTIAVEFRINGRTGPQSKGIRVESNDPKTPVYILKIKGTAISPIMFDPMYLRFDNIRDDEVHVKTLKVWTTKEDVSFKLTDLDLSSLSFLKTEVKTIEVGKRYEVLVSNPDPMPVGRISGSLIVKTDHEKHPATTIRVYGQVIGPLECRPPEIRVRFSDDPEERSNMNIQILSGRVKDFVITEVVPPLEGIKAELDPHGENNYIIRLTGMPMDGRLENQSLLLKTTIPDMPEVKIPFVVDDISRRRVMRAREAKEKAAETREEAVKAEAANAQ